MRSTFAVLRSWFCRVAPRNHGGDPLRRILCDGGDDVGVEVRSDRRRTVSESLAYDLHRDACSQREAGAGVPQVVEPDGRQSGVSGQPNEQVAHVVGPEHLAVLSSEDETSVDPRLTPVGTFLVLTLSVVTKGLDRARVEWDHPDAASSLRRAEAEAAGRVDQLLDDAQITIVEIFINPAQATGS